MKSVSIIVKKLEEAGVKDAEKVVVDVFGALGASLPEIALDAETSAVEKGFAAVAGPVLMALKPTIEKLADFNKDGKIG